MQPLALRCISEINADMPNGMNIADILTEGKLYLKNLNRIGSSYERYISEFKQIATFKFDGIESGNYLFKHLRLRGVRKFPADSYYGLQFPETSKDKPVGLVLLGSNGSGKSTLYGAMEYLCTGNVGEAQLRNTPIEEYFGGNDRPDVHIEAVKNLNNIIGKFPLNTFFCSEYNLIEMAKQFQTSAEQSAYRPYAELMGLGELVHLVNFLRSFDYETPAHKEDAEMFLTLFHVFSKMTPAEEDSLVLRYIIQGNASEIASRTDAAELCKALASILSEVEPLVNEVKLIQSNFGIMRLAPGDNPLVSTLELSNLESFKTGIEKLNVLLHYLNQVYNTYRDIKDSTHGLSFKDYPIYPYKEGKTSPKRAEELNKLKGDFAQKLEQALIDKVHGFVDDEFSNVVISILKEGRFINNSVEKVEFVHTSAGIDVGIKVKNVEKRISPAVYFNTFRLRLFCLCVRMAAACKLMWEHGVVFPIIYDDIFYSSDYENRDMLKAFFKELHEHYYVYACKGETHPQLIFFTHDEQIFSVVENQLRRETEETNINFGRLLEYASTETTFKAGGEDVRDLCITYHDFEPSVNQ